MRVTRNLLCIALMAVMILITPTIALAQDADRVEDRTRDVSGNVEHGLIPNRYVIPQYPLEMPVPGTATIINCWYLNVREQGYPQAGVIGVLRVSDVVVVLESNPWNWHLIETWHLGTRNITGWVYGGFIELH